MKKILYILLITSFIEAQQEILLDRVASVVENKIVLMSDVVLAANAVAAQQKINPNTDPLIYQEILESSRESMVEQLLIIEMAEQDSVEILEKDIDKALNQQIDNIIAQTGSKELAEAALGKKISDFKRSYRDDMKGKLLAEKYTSSLTTSISVSRGDVIDFFSVYKDSIPSFPTLYKTHHILIEIKPSEESEKESFKKAMKVKNEILSGLSFEEAAKKYSADPGSKDQGGNLGYVPRGTFVKEFDRVVFTVEKNILTEPIKTQYGYHLIEVLERTGEKVLSRHILIRTETTDLDKKKTYDIINNNAFHLGGLISPGYRMRYKALYKFSGKLPLLEPEVIYDRLGNNTTDAIHSGVTNGIISEIKQTICHYQTEFKFLKVILILQFDF